MSATDTATWTLDTVHSTADFTVKHMVVATFRGTFDTINATLDYDGDTPKITGTVPVSSVVVKDENLYGHLQSPDFFDAERHPEITFVSTAVRAINGGPAVEVDGDLTIKGVTQPVTATGYITEPTEDIAGNSKVGVELTTVIDRTAFGLNWNAPLPKGGVAVENDVTLTVNLEFVAAQGA
ncbi:MAG TPA: YceI family protein [Solirubrobacteraceae bacterium]|nr:YceI family protein [Solirubrobacteraceae bacterium]